MRIRFDICNPIIVLTMLLAAFSYAHSARAQGCPGDDGHLDIVTTNVLFFSPEKSLGDRLATLVEQLHALDIAVPDVVLGQEFLRGLLAEEPNSPQLFEELLEETFLGEEYTRAVAFETGIPFLFSTANVIYVREPCTIEAKLVKFLPGEEIVKIGSFEIPLTRNVVMVLVNAGGELLSISGTHLCAGGCPDDVREDQNDAALAFIENVESFLESFHYSPILTIYGGDLNSDNFRGELVPGMFGPEKAMIYDKITDPIPMGAGFTDGYFQGQLNAAMTVSDLADLCPDENDPDEHCTTGVTPLDGDTARRIDYVFYRFKNFDMSQTTKSTVIFNSLVDSEPEVKISDHAGVVVSTKLP